MKALLELTKPKITRLVLIAAAAGFYMGTPDAIDAVLLLHLLLGTALVASGTNGLNQWWEREIDARMHRTRNRPLPSGRLSPGRAFWFATGCAVVGVTYLLVTTNLTTSVLAALTVVSYVMVYTPLKRKTTLSTVIGSVPGALPILGGWTAAGGQLGYEAWVLFGIMFLWQVPHFLALAWLFREDYRRGGFAMVSVFDESGVTTGRQAVVYSLLLLPLSLLPTVLGLTGTLYLAAAALLGVMLMWYGIRLASRPSAKRARGLFLSSIAYLPLLLLFLVVDKI
jgi:protoheme IX farnesyltransferase